MKKKLVVIIWQVKDIDRTTIFKDSDELKYSITIWAKFKVDFKSPDASGAAESNIPEKFRLNQNYPNPFNPTTQIRYDLPKENIVSIAIFDVMGRKIRSLMNMNKTAGYHTIRWDARNDMGESVSAGMYIYTIEAGGFRATKKMVLLK